MDLLNNSSTGAAPAKQVNNLVSPKTNNLMMVSVAESTGIDGDDEQSPVRLPAPSKANADSADEIENN